MQAASSRLQRSGNGAVKSCRLTQTTQASQSRSGRKVFWKKQCLRLLLGQRNVLHAEPTAQEYNASMQRGMGWEDADPYEYYPERGLYYHEVWPNLYCGSQPQTKEDVRDLAVLLGTNGSILSLQQDKDMEYWGIPSHELQLQARHCGLTYHRCPAKDFDPHSLRSILPRAVRTISKDLASERKLYVHCTAGLGRAPAACIAYLYWFHHFQLEGAFQHLVEIRPCGPKKDVVRGATFDLLDHRPWEEFFHIPEFSYSELNSSDKANLQRALSHM